MKIEKLQEIGRLLLDKPGQAASARDLSPDDVKVLVMLGAFTIIEDDGDIAINLTKLAKALEDD
jgi:hypothetical protein